MTGVLLALAASGAWGVSDFLAGVRARTLAMPVVLLLSQLAGLTVLLAATSGGMAAASGGRSGGSALALSGVILVTAALAGAAGAGALGLLYLAMARGGIIVVAPVAAGAAAIPVLAGLLAGESLTTRSWVGIGCALAGALCAALPRHDRESGQPVGSDRTMAALAGSGSALCSGTFFVLLRTAADAGDPFAVTLANRVCACALVAAWALGCRPDLAGVRRAKPLALLAVALVGVGDAVAELCFAAASTRVPLGVATSLASLYPAVAVLLALVVLGERLRPVGAAGIGFALAGVVLLGAG